MKRLILLLALALALMLTSCGGPDVVLDSDYEGESSAEVITEKDIEEYHAIMYPEDYPENPYNLESEVASAAEIKMGSYKKDSDVIDCTVSAPDVYAYLMENQDALMELDEEDLYTAIHNAIENKEIGNRTVSISLPVQNIDGTIVASTDSDEYRDAVSGGLYSALSDIYAEILADSMEAQK